jgi:hypothetical protein
MTSATCHSEWIGCESSPAEGNLHRVILCLDEQISLLKQLDDLIPRVESLHALEKLSSILIEGTVVVHDVDKLEIVSLSDFIIIRIVCRGDLHSSGSEFHVDDDRICHDWDSAVDEWMNGIFPM